MSSHLSLLHILVLAFWSSSNVQAFQPSGKSSSRLAAETSLMNSRSPFEIDNSAVQTAARCAATASLCALLTVTTPSAQAYDPVDYASDTVKSTVQLLKNSNGDVEATFKAYEILADIITEGTGVGGAVNYKGVQLDRGYVADEDTAVYNPGLSLLTESEKDRLLAAVIDARKAGVAAKTWNGDVELGFSYLKTRLDPLHVYELKGYLGVFPFYAAVVYVAVLGVQQFLRDSFPAAYFAGVAALFIPALGFIALGPQ
mmetsp:Transcript_12503/g.16445  ORF Transcript_12503/g.16445 Transcript_12503/m.16445 type:complete len:257 (+) Transcript_12503:109-879(+)|eukprot:CAMPEP_0198141748 /NCGR_PEP_ID=MMETSP1443-20131203/4695_1 /TAXON_ID=186043 /ORGANISM="Entomoneis sp., Strain CCMP2396" /LENGTH=256 /DNA_ID=CAMNT_0043804577 /DNA_START=79 /DNA_END=849 /DNA_ORIENTATION=-